MENGGGGRRRKFVTRLAVCALTLSCVLGLINCQTATEDTVVVSTPPVYSVIELGHATVFCNVTGTNASILYEWKREGEVAPITTEPMLHVYNIRDHQTDNYTCHVTVSTPFWRGRSTTLILVQFFPRWKLYAPTRFAGHPGASVQLECRIRARPSVSFEWSFKGRSMARASGDLELDDEYVSVFPIVDVTPAMYGTYTCKVSNAIGNSTYNLELEKPGIPVGPHYCSLVNVTTTIATVMCLPGYDGGEDISFPTELSSPHLPPAEAGTSFTWLQDGHALITVRGLRPSTNYTLLVYMANVHGRSEEAFAVDANTEEGVYIPPKDEPLPFAVIIGASVCGALLLLLLVLLTIFLVRRKNIAKKKANKGEENTENKNNQRQEKKRKSFRDNKKTGSLRSRGGFGGDSARFGFGTGSVKGRRGRGRQSGGPMYNIAYAASQSDIIRPGPRDSDIFHLAGFPSAEPNVNNTQYHDNTAFTPDVNETTFSGRRKRAPLNTPPGGYHDNEIIPAGSPMAPNFHSDAHVYTDAIRNAQRLSQEQPGLAGQGALSVLPILAPVTPPQSAYTQGGYGNHNDGNYGNQVQETNLDASEPNEVVKQENEQNLTYSAVHPRDTSYQVPEEVWEFPREKLYIRQKIGEGLVGEVWRARAQGILGREGEVLVAVKMLKDDYTDEEYRAMMRELKVMKMLQPHPNIVSLLGQCTKTEPPFIIMEYCTNGNLQQLLRCQRLPEEDVYRDRGSHYASMRYRQRLTSRDLVVFALHIARGMEYISSKEFLHRDLAARNVLVDENLICQISDFGLARDVAKSRQYESRTQGRLPIRWMAPESLFDCIYSTKSDVWSFGVLLWEVVTLGSSPYPGMAGPDVMELIQMGYRMDKPKLCSDHLYSIMHDCWRHNPKQRPSFTSLVEKLEAILRRGQELDIYVEQMSDNMYEIFDSLPGEKC